MFNIHDYKKLDDSQKTQYVKDCLIKSPVIMLSSLSEISQTIVNAIFSNLDENSNSLLHLAIKNDNAILTDFILTKTMINPFLKNKDGHTAFSLCSNKALVNYLVSQNLLINEKGVFEYSVLHHQIAIGREIGYIGDSEMTPKCLYNFKTFSEYLANYPNEKNSVLSRLEQYLQANQPLNLNQPAEIMVHKLYNNLIYGTESLQQLTKMSAFQSIKKLTYNQKKVLLAEELRLLNQLAARLNLLNEKQNLTKQILPANASTPTSFTHLRSCLGLFRQMFQTNEELQLMREEETLTQDIVNNLKQYFNVASQDLDLKSAERLLQLALQDQSHRLQCFQNKIPRASDLGLYGMKKHTLHPPISLNEDNPIARRYSSYHTIQ